MRLVVQLAFACIVYGLHGCIATKSVFQRKDDEYDGRFLSKARSVFLNHIGVRLPHFHVVNLSDVCGIQRM